MKQNLLQYPTDWNNLLNLFEPKLTKPQFNNFCQATTCIAVSCYTSINQWSKVFDKKHQSNLNDFFTESPWEDSEIHTKLSRIITLRIKDANIGIIDDTFNHKPYAKKMANLGIFHNGLTKKRAKGL